LRTRRKYEGRLDEVPGIFATMKPMDGAIEAYKRLATVFDTYILSTAP
jgi:5'(3')-deoxyribonucleotidase